MGGLSTDTRSETHSGYHVERGVSTEHGGARGNQTRGALVFRTWRRHHQQGARSKISSLEMHNEMAIGSIEFRVGVTDRDWFRYFRERPNLTEMNFWRPGTPHTRVERGTPWLFLLKPNTVAGCAFVEVSSSLPLSVMWDAFESGNGFDTKELFFRRIAELRRGKTTVDSQIGCVGLSSPVFFDDPFDFAPYQGAWTNRSQPTKRFTTDTPDGAALWREIQLRLRAEPTHSLSPPASRVSIAQRLTNVRMGQGGFRTSVIDAYERRCAVSGERSLAALEAAHIKPFSIVQRHETSNGILLRADIHKLFDVGYVSVDPDLHFKVSRALRDEYSNGRIYYALHGQELRLPVATADQPNREYLEWHYSEVFRG